MTQPLLAASPQTPSLRHLLSVQDLNRDQAMGLLNRAGALSETLSSGAWQIPEKSQGTLINLFLENSTRTRISFEIAAQKLGLAVVNMAAEGSSVLKGESLIDTLETLAAMRPRALVIRHSGNGAAALAARHAESFGVSVVNAGDGVNEHPSQALLDALTIRQATGALEGMKIVICGDIRHSRVAHSDAWLLSLLGARLTLCGPASFLPEAAARGADWPANLSWTTSFDEALAAGADVVMMLRIQKERIAQGETIACEDYQSGYRLDHQRLAHFAPKALVMHPGPVNRDIEITGALADDRAKSLILRQVANGIPVRMAILADLLGL